MPLLIHPGSRLVPVTTDRRVIDTDLHAYVDGQLSPDRRAAVEEWLATRPEEAERVADYRELSKRLRAAYGPILSEPIPERLASQRPRWRLPAAGLWLAVGTAIGLAATWNFAPYPPGPAVGEPQPVARRAALAHAVYSPEVRHPVEVTADQLEHLVAWLSARLGMPVRAPDLIPAGLFLLGGRLLPGEHGPSAQLMYQSANGHRITLYICSGPPMEQETAFRYAREHDVRVLYWIDRGRRYALASADLSRSELLEVAHLAYEELHP